MVGSEWLVVTGSVSVSDAPWLSVTRTVAVKSASVAYLCVTTAPVAVGPSPKSQLTVTGPPPGSYEALASKRKLVLRSLHATGSTVADTAGGQFPPHPR